VEQSNRLNRGHAGLLTSDSRDNWFASYTTLKENNSESIDTIEDSLFLLCLDDNLDSHNADVLTKAGYNSLHGIGTTVNATNRWYDKALQFIVAKSGEVSITNEHSFAEAVPTMAIADHIIDYIDQLTTAADDDMRQDIQNVSPPEHIPFILDEPINDRIDIAAKNLDS
jgi:carnitine O-acetyltransferase